MLKSKWRKEELNVMLIFGGSFKLIMSGHSTDDKNEILRYAKKRLSNSMENDYS